MDVTKRRESDKSRTTKLSRINFEIYIYLTKHQTGYEVFPATKKEDRWSVQLFIYLFLTARYSQAQLQMKTHDKEQKKRLEPDR